MAGTDNTTVIRNAAWIASWDGEAHRYLKAGDVAFTADRIVHVGGRYDGPAARTIEAFEFHDGRWLLIATAQDDDPIRIPPFDAVAFSLGRLWP